MAIKRKGRGYVNSRGTKKTAYEYVRENYTSLNPDKLNKKEKQAYERATDYKNRWAKTVKFENRPVPKLLADLFKTELPNYTPDKDLKNFITRESYLDLLESASLDYSIESLYNIGSGSKKKNKDGDFINVLKFIQPYRKANYELIIINDDGKEHKGSFGLEVLKDFQVTMLNNTMNKVKQAKKRGDKVSPIFQIRYSVSITENPKSIVIDLRKAKDYSVI